MYKNIRSLLLLLLSVFISRISVSGIPITVAVIEPESYGVSGAVAESFWSGLIDEFVDNRRFQVVERSRLEEVLDELAFSRTDIVSAETAVEVGSLIGAEYVVISSISSIEGVYFLNTRMIEVSTGVTVASSSGEANTKNLVASAAKLARGIAAEVPVKGEIVGIVDGESVVIDIGTEDNVEVGMRFKVYKLAESTVDSGSGLESERENVGIGKVEAVDVQAHGAKCKITERTAAIDLGDLVESDIKGFYEGVTIEDEKDRREQKPYLYLSSGFANRFYSFNVFNEDYKSSLRCFSVDVCLGYRFGFLEYDIGWRSVIPVGMEIDPLPPHATWTYIGFASDFGYIGGLTQKVVFAPFQNKTIDPEIGFVFQNDLAVNGGYDLRYMYYDQSEDRYEEYIFSEEFERKGSFGSVGSLGFRFGRELNTEITIGFGYYFTGIQRWFAPVGVKYYL
jgi:TolB-like protein